MISEHVVKSGLEYLDLCFKNDALATLYRMTDYIDSRNFLIATSDELTEILRRHKLAYMQRNKIRLITNESSQAVTEEESGASYAAYEMQFDTELKELLKQV